MVDEGTGGVGEGFQGIAFLFARRGQHGDDGCAGVRGPRLSRDRRRPCDGLRLAQGPFRGVVIRRHVLAMLAVTLL